MEKLYSLFKQSTGICTDTRKVKKGSLFVALKGANFDGNLFASDALSKGALVVVIDDADIADSLDNDSFILVNDGLNSLQDLASYHRNQLNIPIIGITGTNGKTTTKELCHAVLSTEFKCYATKGNLNNHIGVPLSLLEVTQGHDLAIIEMGANHQGEIADLCKIAKPTIGIITNIGKAHLEGFGSFANIVLTKNELYSSVIDAKGTILYNLDDTLLVNLIGDYKITFSYSRTFKNSDFFYELGSNEICAGVIFDKIKVDSKLFGGYNGENIACAIALAIKMNVSKEGIVQGIENYEPGNNRSQLVSTSSNDLILDAYNANPSSMLNAVGEFLNLESAQEKILILGDMLELGSFSDFEHQKLVNEISSKRSSFAHCHLVGKEFQQCKVAKDQGVSVHASVQELKNIIINSPLNGNLIFLKGSRGIKLEELIDLL